VLASVLEWARASVLEWELGVLASVLLCLAVVLAIPLAKL